MSDYILMAGDVDAIKDYVFETSSLPQIRGGSELLQECEEEIEKKYEDYVIYCGGGSFLLRVPPDQAEKIGGEIERLYLEKTLAVTVTVVYEQGMPSGGKWGHDRSWMRRIQVGIEDVPLDGGFAQRVLFLNARIREAKLGKVIAPFDEAMPFGKRCERCGKRMASGWELVEGGAMLCRICQHRDEKGRKREEEIRGRFNREFWDQRDEGWKAGQPDDLDQLVESARRKYLAFLYADGNDIGGLLRRMRDPDSYKEVSQALKEGTKRALFTSLKHVCGAALQREHYWPFDIVNIGGDDVTILVQAGYAWDLAVEFLERFEDEVGKRLPKDLNWKPTASCAILIADAKYPIRYMERLAASLLKMAKKRAKEDPTNLKSAVTFLWMPSPVVSESVTPLLDLYQPKEWIRLTARPYTLEEAQLIRKQIPEIARWSRTTRHRWAEALAKGPIESLNFIQYDLARERGAQHKIDLIKTLGSILSARGWAPIEGLPIWHRATKGRIATWHTPLIDVLELAELQAMRPDVEEGEG